MMQDSPVKFPALGALPAKFAPDVKVASFPSEKEYSISDSPCRSLAQIAAIQAQMPRGEFTPPPGDWKNLPRTKRVLTEGGTLRVLGLGDSIVNDTMRSGWLAKLAEAYPKAKIHGTVYVRGSGGCQHYKEENRIAQYAVPQKPDLVFIGGISQKDIASVREVIRQLRAALPEVEFLLATGTFGTADPRSDTELSQAAHSGSSAFGAALKQLAAEEKCAFLDMTTPWAQYIRSSGVHPHLFYRDHVHANEFGEQIPGKILLSFFMADDLWLPARLEQFQDWKFGFMMHWAPYSQWGCIESWPLIEVDKWARPDDLPAWTERGKDIERFKRDYWLLPKTFNPVKFDPQKWAQIASDAGMKYVVFTTKHHDGFSMYDTRLSDYRITAADVPFHDNPRADVVKEVFSAFRGKGFGIGAYFSKADWRSPHYWNPDAPARDRNPNYDTLAQPEKWAKFVDFAHGQIKELMTGYGPVDILWLDAGQVRPPKQNLQMDNLVAMARGFQPRLIVVDRAVGGRHENYRTPEQEVPKTPPPFVWETCMTMGEQWSYKPNDEYKSTRQLVHLLVDVVGKGGNFLLNVGPQPDGELPAAAIERMNEIGAWLKVNGDAIYGTRAIAPYKTGQIVYTAKGNTLNAIYLADDTGELPAQITISSLAPAHGTRVRLLGVDAPLAWKADDKGNAILEIPENVRKTPPCQHALVFQWQRAAAAPSENSPKP